MRFVAVCANGHLSDVPWVAWAHSQAKSPEQKQCASINLALLRSKTASAGLDSLRVMCRSCKAGRSLAGISSKDSLVPLTSRWPDSTLCNGTQPWQRRDAGESCAVPLQVVQRGASNVYFASVVSALDIPPGSNYDPLAETTLAITSDPKFAVILDAPTGPASPMLIDVLASDFGVSAAKISQLVEHSLAAKDGKPIESTTDDDGDLHAGEWRAFTAPDEDTHPKSSFVKRTTTLVVPGSEPAGAVEQLDLLVDSVVIGTRLREVRALTGFSRYQPAERVVRPDLGRGLEWLPAIEVFGEGVFVSVQEQPLRAWESHAAVRSIGEVLEERRAASLLAARLRTASPRFVMLHTFAHLLIRQLAFECGYAAASLRERVYAQPPEYDKQVQAGVLIYTAAGDSEGTLGGLASQGGPPRMALSILRALERASWCSTDPLCRENSGQGFGALNRAACHACSLLPETSCETGNKLLDRTLVVGGDGVPGFFEQVISAGLASAAELVEADA